MQKQTTQNSAAKKTTAPTFKQLARAINNEGKPRGLKVRENDAGGCTFTYGPKSAPVTVYASSDELIKFALSFLGLKLS